MSCLPSPSHHFYRLLSPFPVMGVASSGENHCMMLRKGWDTNAPRWRQPTDVQRVFFKKRLDPENLGCLRYLWVTYVDVQFVCFFVCCLFWFDLHFFRGDNNAISDKQHDMNGIVWMEYPRIATVWVQLTNITNSGGFCVYVHVYWSISMTISGLRTSFRFMRGSLWFRDYPDQVFCLGQAGWLNKKQSQKASVVFDGDGPWSMWFHRINMAGKNHNYI